MTSSDNDPFTGNYQPGYSKQTAAVSSYNVLHRTFYHSIDMYCVSHAHISQPVMQRKRKSQQKITGEVFPETTVVFAFGFQLQRKGTNSFGLSADLQKLIRHQILNTPVDAEPDRSSDEEEMTHTRSREELEEDDPASD